MHEEAIDALHATNSPERLFLRRQSLVRVVDSPDDGNIIQGLDERMLEAERLRSAIFIGQTGTAFQSR